MASRFRRLHSTERLTDRLSHLAGEALDADRIDVARAGLILRELRDFQKLEREHLGIGRVHAGPTDQRSQVPPPSVLAAPTPSHKRIGDQPFRDLIRDHLDDIGPEALAAATPQEKLILATQDILTANPEILDALHAEFAEHSHAEAREKVATRRRR